MTPDWQPLREELAAWRREGRILPVWWRDDDAITDTPALHRLEEMAARHGIPVHLAVIPKRADAALAARVGASAHLIPLQHGWSHRNHGAGKKAEHGPERPVAARRTEIAEGQARLRALFGDGLAPVFVPPWNRIGADMLPELTALGFKGVSAFAPRPAREAAPGLAAVNTHLDPIDWNAGGGLLPQQALIDEAARLLADRRTGAADPDEPFGLLTHHLVHDDAIWRFTDEFWSEMAAGPLRAWRCPPSGELLP